MLGSVAYNASPAARSTAPQNRPPNARTSRSDGSGSVGNSRPPAHTIATAATATAPTVDPRMVALLPGDDCYVDNGYQVPALDIGQPLPRCKNWAI